MLKLKLQYLCKDFAPHANSWLIGKDPDAGRDCKQEKKGMSEDEMAGWYHWLDGRESEWTPGDEAWRAVIYGVAKSQIRLSDWTELRAIYNQVIY